MSANGTPAPTPLNAFTSEPWVVICNYGRGCQTAWPSGLEPGLYTQADAEELVRRQNDARSPYSTGGPHSQAHWHAKSLSQALEYVSPGNTCYGAFSRLADEAADMGFSGGAAPGRGR